MHQTVYNKPRLRLVPANSSEGRSIACAIDTMKRRANDARRAGLIDADLRRRIVEQVTINAGVTP